MPSSCLQISIVNTLLLDKYIFSQSGFDVFLYVVKKNPLNWLWAYSIDNKTCMPFKHEAHLILYHSLTNEEFVYWLKFRRHDRVIWCHFKLHFYLYNIRGHLQLLKIPPITLGTALHGVKFTILIRKLKFNAFFSSPVQRPCELLPSLGVRRRPSVVNFHI